MSTSANPSGTPIQIMPGRSTPKKPPQVQKEDSMLLQKELINGNYHELARARQENRKVSATFVPGNLNELLMCFDFARSLPETNALQNGLRKKSGKMIMDAERDGHSEDVCTYVKADLGMMLQGVLAKHKVPYTAFKYAENTGQMAPIREQAGTFADSIKLWSAA